MTLDELDWLKYEFGDRNSPLPDWPMATAKQIHSAQILDACGSGGMKGEGDALVTNVPGVAVGIRTADCVPILLADPATRVVAAIHAGWRGAALEIARRTIEYLTENYTTRPANVVAAIGPAIGMCCFEVGPEVAREFAKWEPRLAESTGKEHLDLPALNALQLTAAGVPAGNIVKSSDCTVCGGHRFHSFRRDRERSGRMVAWIGILQ